MTKLTKKRSQASGRAANVATPALHRPLLAWYRRHRRDLPWRGTRDPYAVWLSELMLQQTQVATVIPYYERFLKGFPDVHTLARAPLDDVLRHWAGLGYYARARNLHAAARQVVERYAGQFPDSVDELRSLPGIGRYTAGAIASIAFDRRAAVVDGNVARVLARLLAIREPIKTPRTAERIWRIAESLIPARNCGDFNQALMELGATVCTPRNPACPRCPVRTLCLARTLGLVNQIPVTGRARPPKPIEFVVAAIQSGDAWLLQKRPPGGLWGGLWELPGRERRGRRATWRIAQDLALDCAGIDARIDRKPVAEVRWHLTHRTARFIVHRVQAPPTYTRKNCTTARWLRLDCVHEIPVSTAMQRIVALLVKRTSPATAAENPRVLIQRSGPLNSPPHRMKSPAPRSRTAPAQPRPRARS